MLGHIIGTCSQVRINAIKGLNRTVTTFAVIDYYIIKKTMTSSLITALIMYIEEY